MPELLQWAMTISPPRQLHVGQKTLVALHQPALGQRRIKDMAHPGSGRRLGAGRVCFWLAMVGSARCKIKKYPGGPGRANPRPLLDSGSMFNPMVLEAFSSPHPEFMLLNEDAVTEYQGAVELPEIAAGPPPYPPSEAYTPTRKWGTLLAVGLSIFMSTLDVTIVQVTLPTLVRDLHTDFTTIEWVIFGLHPGGNLPHPQLRPGRGHVRAKKRLYLIGVTLFTVGSLLCGLAPSVGWLIVFRVLQGTGRGLQPGFGHGPGHRGLPAQRARPRLGHDGQRGEHRPGHGPGRGRHHHRLLELADGVSGEQSRWVWSACGPSSVSVNTQRSTVKPPPFDLAGAFFMVATLVAYALAMTYGQQIGFMQHRTLILMGVVLGGAGVFHAHTSSRPKSRWWT